MNWLLWCLIGAAPGPDPVLAVAGADTLRRAEFQLQLAIDGGYDVSPENIRPLLETWVAGMLLYREASRRGLGQDETTAVLAAEAEKDYLVGLMTHRISDTIKVSDNEIYDYYNRHKLDFVTQLRMQYMVLPDEQSARQATADLKRPGAKFAALAQERSLDRAVNPGAELTMAGRNDSTVNMDPLLEDTVFTLAAGKLSPPLKVGTQYWLIEVLDRTRMHEELPLEKVRDYISKFLELKKRRRALEQTLAALRKRAKVSYPKTKGAADEVLAKVGDSVLTRHRLLLQLPPGQSLNEDNLRQVTDVWVNTELFTQEARRLGVGSDETTRAVMSEKTREYVTNLLLDRVTGGIAIPNNDVFDYFQKHKEEFMYDVKILHVLCGSDSAAQTLLADIKNGADFKKLAQERSADRALTQGEESRYLDRLDPQGKLNPELEEMIFSLKVGAVSPPIRTNQGYWIVKVTDRKQVRNDVTFDQAKERISTFLHERHYRQVVDSLLAELRKNQVWSVLPANYWAN
jgi:parvulin-like peptidyl-prolyl isomerase